MNDGHTSLSCIRPAVSMSTTSKSLSFAVLGGQLSMTALLQKQTVCNRFFRDPCSILSVPLLVELHAAFAISAVNSEHAQVAHVNPELLDSTTPTNNHN